MDVVINNKDNLNINELDKVTNKVRAIILDQNNNVIINEYGNTLMFPGGKVEPIESNIEGLIRELNEELGIKFQKQDFVFFKEYHHYLKNYPTREGDVINKLNNTKYYIVKSNQDIDVNNMKLTDKEKNCFKSFKINLQDINDYLNSYKSVNPRNQIFKRELLDIANLLLKDLNINNQELIDMHIHTIYSDGEYAPKKIIEMCIKRGVHTLAITDHDTVDGIRQVNKSNYNLNIINGIELTAKVDKGRMHILGYDFDIDNKELNTKLIDLRNNSYYSVLAIINQLKIDYGIIFNYNDIQDIFNNKGNIGRPHIAKILIKYGFVNSVQEAFDKYLINTYQKTRTNNKGISYQECIKLIKDANGLAILAHPNQLLMNDNELERLLNKMIGCGLDGIEVYHSGHSKEEINKYLKIAKKYNLLISGGSDYHGKTVKPSIEIGSGYNNNIKIKKLSLVDYINKRVL